MGGSRKTEKLFRSASSLALRNAVLLADGLYSISSEYGCEASGDVVEGEAYVFYRGCELGRELFELGELMELGVPVHLVRGTGGRTPGEMLEEASRHALDVASELWGHALETSSTGVEYVLLVLRTGEVYVAEGSMGRVSLPYVSGVMLEAHTHPASCVPSERDAVSSMERFMEGLYAAAVVGPDCVTLVYRRGPLTEEDVIALRDLPELVGELAPGPGGTDLGNLRIIVLPR